MWELNNKEGWVLKNWCFQIVVLKKTFESPLDSKEIKSVNPKGNQSWIFIGRTDAEAETRILRSPNAKSQLIEKDPDAGKDWGQQKGVTENEMAGWYHWPNGHEFELTLGDSKGQGSLVCCSPWRSQRVKHNLATEQQQRYLWRTRRSNQAIQKEINPEYSLEGLMLKLKLQYSGHLMWRTESLEKNLMLGQD